MSDFPMTGKIDEHGNHPRLDDYVKAVKYFCFSRKGKTVELLAPKKLSQTRSGKQNRYYYGLIGLLVKHTGYTKEELHEGFKARFLKQTLLIGKDELVSTMSTSKIGTDEMAEYTEKIREWQKENLPECYLPTADEWKKWEQGESLTNYKRSRKEAEA